MLALLYYAILRWLPMLAMLTRAPYAIDDDAARYMFTCCSAASQDYIADDATPR